MKRFYVILVLAIAVALALAVGISKHTGYVLITYPHLLHYESSLWATLVAVFVIGLAIYLIRVLLSLLSTSGGVVNPWSRRNRSRRVQIAIEHGQMDLAEGAGPVPNATCIVPPKPNASRCCITLARPGRQTSKGDMKSATACWSAPSSDSPRPNWRLP